MCDSVSERLCECVSECATECECVLYLRPGVGGPWRVHLASLSGPDGGQGGEVGVSLADLSLLLLLHLWAGWETTTG